MTDQQDSGERYYCQACSRGGLALKRSGHADGCQVAALEAEVESLREERDELVREMNQRAREVREERSGHLLRIQAAEADLRRYKALVARAKQILGLLSAHVPPAWAEDREAYSIWIADYAAEKEQR